MSKGTLETGYFLEKLPWVKMGSGHRTLVVLDDLKVEHTLPAGLALQGLKDAFGEVEGVFTLTHLGLPRGLAEGTTVSDLAEALVEFLKARFDRPVELLAQGISVPIALEIARRTPEVIQHLWLVSGAPGVSSPGKILMSRLLEAGRHHRWARVHGLLAGTLFSHPLGKWLGGALAALLASDLGRPANPWDFLVVLQALAAWDPEPAALAVPMNIWVGLRDELFDADTWDAWLEVNPDAVLEMVDKPHGLLKLEREKIFSGLRVGLQGDRLDS